MKRIKSSRRIIITSIVAIPMIMFVMQFMNGGRDYLEKHSSMMVLSQIEQHELSSTLSSIAPASGGNAASAKVNVHHLGLDFDSALLPQPQLAQEKATVQRSKDRSAASILKGLEFFKPIKPNESNKSKITIIIDDMGMGRSTTNMLNLPKGGLTFAYLPSAPNLSEQTKRAKKAGHELMVHMPMQPLDEKISLGETFLKSDMGEEEFLKQLEENLDTFEGYVGVNNHMGSKLTQDSRSMKMVMETLKKRGLLFVDSRTIQTSIAAETAKSFFVPYETRDVFLDHDADIASIRSSLLRLEGIARTNGHAIAIGHPRPTTIQALKEWLPTLKDKNIELVNISSMVKKPKPLPTLITSHEKITETHYQ